ELDITPPATAPTLGSAGDDVGPLTGALTDGGLTDDPRPTFTGSGAEPDGTVNVYDNGTLIGTAAVDANGDWSFTPATDLGDGAHSITFSAVDAAGNEGPPSAPFSFDLDTTPPAATALDGASDDVGTVTGALIEGEV